jgi:hypothetical protein
LLAAALFVGAGDAAPAADDCLAGPNRQATPGAHWYYRIDRATHRRCWYLKQPATEAPAVAAPQPGTAAAATPGPDNQRTIFSTIFSALNGAPPPKTASAPSTEAGSAEAAAPAGPKRRIATHSVSARAVPPKPRRDQAATEPDEAPTSAEHEALFREFLSWRQMRMLSQ